MINALVQHFILKTQGSCTTIPSMQYRNTSPNPLRPPLSHSDKEIMTADVVIRAEANAYRCGIQLPSSNVSYLSFFCISQLWPLPSTQLYISSHL